MRGVADITRKAEESKGEKISPVPPSNVPVVSGTASHPNTTSSASPSTVKLVSSPTLPGFSTNFGRAVSIAPPPPPPPPHSSQTQIPFLSSAPPSGNLSNAALWRDYLAAPQTQPTTTVPTSLPPPPPPPPKRNSALKTGSLETRNVSPTRVAIAPTMVALPPPRASLNSVFDSLSPTSPDGEQTFSTSQEDDDDDDDEDASPGSNKSKGESQDNQVVPNTSGQQQELTPTKRLIRLPPNKPQPLPYTTFIPSYKNSTATPGTSSSLLPPLLAHRQETLTILLVATEAAHKMAWKNNLILADLFTGLMNSVTTTQNNTSTLSPFRSATRSLPVLWTDLNVVFLETIAPLSDDQAQELLQQAAALQPADGNLTKELDILEDQVDNLLLPLTPLSLQQDLCMAEHGNWHEQRQRQLDQVTKDAFSLTSPLTLPWLRRYRIALDHVTSYTLDDLTACPTIALFVCTTTELSNPIETLKGLQEVPHYLPAQFHNGLWNPASLSRHVLVLHDQVEGPRSDWDEAPLRQALMQTFGSTAALLRINTIAPETAEQLEQEETSDLWQGGGHCGNCLSVSDRVTLRKYLAGLVTSALLPALERRIAQLNAVVSERKKGVRNVLKSFWRTGKTQQELDQEAAERAAGSGVRYRFDSIESQTRLLADTLFLMKDYEQALATYRLIRDDYKQDKAHAHYASCHEMMALCMHFLDPYGRARDVFSSMETALMSYKKAALEEETSKQQQQRVPGQRSLVAPPSTRAGSRLCLVLIGMQAQNSSSRNLEVADLLASASSNETALGAAVLLEQASVHYYQDEKFRKYAFHMLMSGHMFRTAEQEHHAFRCFTSALHIYRDAQWDELHNHIRSALAAQLYSMGRMALSLQLYAKLVGSPPRVSVKSQQKFINHLLEICSEHPKKAMAGADRMVYPVVTRRERLERITQVVQFTKTAARALELPNMQLPFIDDETVVVVAEEGGSNPSGDGSNNVWGMAGQRAAIGKSGRGEPEVWSQLILETIAELRASEAANSDKTTTDDVMTKVLAKIEDKTARKMIAEIDKEKAQRNLAERAKKLASFKPSPPVRALMEPLTVEFVMHNYLGIPIDIVDLQIVACMSSSDKKVICTNEDAIQITPLASRNERRTWVFHSSTLEFSVPHFARVSQPKKDEDDAKTKWKSAYEADPFFVVTKTPITLAPESSKTISASVCPLVEGDIEILGVRFRLFDSVWVFHPFSVKGELLQNTRSNRAKRVRAESLLLKAKVEQGMPCLTADLVHPMSSKGMLGDSGPLLQGQISKWNLRLSNVGTAPAKSITLKTNVPWITIWDGGDEDRTSKSLDELERQATSYSVGPSGTLLRIPIDGFGLKVDGEIHPGETVDVAVDLRTYGSGRQEFYMLFRYELVEQNSASVPFRWLRKMLEVPLYPSLTVSATIAPSYSEVAEHILSMEITNYRSDRPDHLHLLIEKITLASRSYRLLRIPGQIGRNAGGKCEVGLGWQERVSLHFRVIPLEEENLTCLLSQSNLSGPPDAPTVTLQASASSMLTFLCLERAHDQFQETLSSHQRALARAVAAQDHGDQQPRSISAIRRANTVQSSLGLDGDNLTDAVVAPTSIRKLTPLESSLASGILVCSWKSEDGAIEGQHHLCGLSIRPIKESNGCPIVITGKYPSQIVNDFNLGPATVPLEVTLRNRLVSHAVDFEFTVERADNFDVTGPECIRHTLAGGEMVQVPLQAILPNAGAYNIQRIRLTIGYKEAPLTYIFPLQWNVLVRDSSHLI